MDIDLLKRKTPLPLSCYRCGEVGHVSNQCLRQFDVRELSIDNLQEILQDRLAQLDVAPAEEAEPAEVTPVTRCRRRGFSEER